MGKIRQAPGRADPAAAQLLGVDLAQQIDLDRRVDRDKAVDGSERRRMMGMADRRQRYFGPPSKPSIERGIAAERCGDDRPLARDGAALDKRAHARSDDAGVEA